MNTVRRVEIEVYENGLKVGSIAISYYEGQLYSVWLTTPDGPDSQIQRQVGDPAAGAAA